MESVRVEIDERGEVGADPVELAFDMPTTVYPPYSLRVSIVGLTGKPSSTTTLEVQLGATLWRDDMSGRMSHCYSTWRADKRLRAAVLYGEPSIPQGRRLFVRIKPGQLEGRSYQVIACFRAYGRAGG